MSHQHEFDPSEVEESIKSVRHWLDRVAEDLRRTEQVLQNLERVQRAVMERGITGVSVGPS